MPFFRWIDAYRVGMPAIDAEHMQLLTMMNELYESLLSGNSDMIVDSVLDGLVDYGERHMRHEETMFVETGYPHAAWHSKQHDAFRKHIRDFREQALTHSSKEVALKALSFLKNWLMGHIEKTDREFVEYLNANGTLTKPQEWKIPGYGREPLRGE